MKPIVIIPNTVLTQSSATVTHFDKKLKKLIEEMKKTLIATSKPRGVGLAAPQVGESLRIFLTRVTTKSPIRTFINPVIVQTSKTQTAQQRSEDGKLEGCLSIPKIWGKVSRASAVTIRYQDEEGIQHTEEIEGFLATILQHETDHLGGILFTQRVLEQKGKLYQTVRDTEGKESLEEIDLQ